METRAPEIRIEDIRSNPVIHKYASRTRQSPEVYYATAFIALTAARLRFNPARGNWQTFSNTVVRNAIISEWRTKQHSKAPVSTYSVNPEFLDRHFSTTDPETSIDLNLPSTLTPLERELCLAFAAGETAVSFATRKNLGHRARVSDMLPKLRVKLLAAGWQP